MADFTSVLHVKFHIDSGYEDSCKNEALMHKKCPRERGTEGKKEGKLLRVSRELSWSCGNFGTVCYCFMLRWCTVLSVAR